MLSSWQLDAHPLPIVNHRVTTWLPGPTTLPQIEQLPMARAAQLIAGECPTRKLGAGMRAQRIDNKYLLLDAYQQQFVPADPESSLQAMVQLI
ncbi:hypothetical protein MU846_01450 [Alcanivorax sp. CY1518]|uniref:Uncharacterized protein n=1 Tax=Alcanivorax quisquiliarum TaxID=2933565 RepID=A0ABT0E3I7_9GAMM|nr:hypothetical protein [Alcanivorax quisquiliarum]